MGATPFQRWQCPHCEVLTTNRLCATGEGPALECVTCGMVVRVADMLGEECEGEFCHSPGEVTLVNGEERQRFCGHCLREQVQDMVMGNLSIGFSWPNDDTLIVE